MKILLIDDDSSFRKMIGFKLRNHDYHILEADNGIDGFEMYLQHNPDLIITDIIMPEEEGYGLIMDIRKEDKDIPIIAITGMSKMGGMNTLKIAEELGANATMTKPIDLVQFQSLVEELLS